MKQGVVRTLRLLPLLSLLSDQGLFVSVAEGGVTNGTAEFAVSFLTIWDVLGLFSLVEPQLHAEIVTVLPVLLIC